MMKNKDAALMPVERITRSILVLRRHRVLLDRDLAEIYGVTTGRLNEAIKRNVARFPEDFMFQLSEPETQNLRSQIAISSWGGRRYLPFVFTEYGAIQAANVLRSPRAIEMSLYVVRAFVQLREARKKGDRFISPNAVGGSMKPIYISSCRLTGEAFQKKGADLFSPAFLPNSPINSPFGAPSPQAD